MAECKKVSDYAELLVKVGMDMTTEDLSNIKLLLHIDGHIPPRLEDFRYPADVLRYLSLNRFMDKTNLGFLVSLLMKIQRKDLANIVKKYETDYAQSDSQMSVDDSDESLPSSQESISDEQKLQQKEKQGFHVTGENQTSGL